jgi:hypothetical protein
MPGTCTLMQTTTRPSRAPSYSSQHARQRKKENQNKVLLCSCELVAPDVPLRAMFCCIRSGSRSYTVAEFVRTLNGTEDGGLKASPIPLPVVLCRWGYGGYSCIKTLGCGDRYHHCPGEPAVDGRKVPLYYVFPSCCVSLKSSRLRPGLARLWHPKPTL